jgi:hypothetical protein
MYIQLDQELTLRDCDIVGYFDIDTASYSARTKKFLKQSEQAGLIDYKGFDIPNSFILAADGRIYLIRSSTRTLLRKAGNKV